MFFKIFFLLYIIDAKIIKNEEFPSCKNCIYYKPPIFHEFTSPYSKCEYFGTKNIHTDIITYDYADLCRKYDDKCSLEGKYFKEDKNINLRFFLHNSVLPNKLLVLFLTLYIYFIMKNELYI